MPMVDRPLLACRKAFLTEWWLQNIVEGVSAGRMEDLVLTLQRSPL